MPRNSNISVKIDGDVDLDQARRDLRADFRKMEADANRAGEDITSGLDDIEAKAKLDDSELTDTASTFDRFAARFERGLDAEINVPTEDLRQAFDLAERLDRLVVDLDIDTDKSELDEAAKLAASLRNFTSRIGLDVDGVNELRDALGLSEQLETIRTVRTQVRGRDELERAVRLADDLERTRTVPIDARADDLVRLDAEFDAAAKGGAASFADAFSGVDVSNLGSSIVGQLGPLASAAGPLAGVAAAIGAVFADDLIAGFERGFDTGQDRVEFALRSGLDPEMLREVGSVGGAAYSAGFGESFGEVRELAGSVQRELGELDSGIDLTESTRQFAAFEAVFGDADQAINTTRRLLAVGLVDDAEQGADAVFAAAQRSGNAWGDIADVLGEFAPVFAKLGVDGLQAIDIITTAVEEGLLPNADRMAETFEEFNIEMTDGAGRAKPVIDELGLSFSDLQDQIARGEGDEALAGVADALLDIGDEARRNELAVQLFGTSIESASDPERVLELLATADAMADVGTAASDAATEIEESVSSFKRLQRIVEATAAEGARLGDGGLAFALGDVGRTAEIAGEKLDFITDKLADIGIGGEASTRRLREIGESVSSIDGFDGSRVLGDALGQAADRMTDAGQAANDFELRVAEAGTAASGTAGEVAYLAEQFGGAGFELSELRAEFDAFNGFDYDRALRSINEQADRLVESLSKATEAVFTFDGEIDRSTGVGRQLEQGLERLNSSLQSLTEQYLDGSISADEYRAGTSELREQFDRVTGAADATGDQIADLEEKYLSLPADVETAVRARDEASRTLADIAAQLGKLDDKTITVTARTLGQIGRAATGGVREGLTLVGEEGPELVDFKTPTRVYTASDTRDLVGDVRARPGLAPPPPPPRPATATQPADYKLAENLTITVPDGRDIWQEVALLAELRPGAR